jgi:hypothetical protein
MSSSKKETPRSLREKSGHLGGRTLVMEQGQRGRLGSLANACHMEPKIKAEVSPHGLGLWTI